MIEKENETNLVSSWVSISQTMLHTRPTVDPCVLEAKLQPGATRYDLEACGCKPPAPPKYEEQPGCHEMAGDWETLSLQSKVLS